MPDVDHGSPVAPYRQIASALRDGISAGTYPPGTRLPSIVDLVQEWGVARLTARKALNLLVDEGLAELSTGMGFFVRQ